MLKGQHPLGTTARQLSVASSSSPKDVLVIVERLSQLSVRESHKGSPPAGSPKNPSPAEDAGTGKENVVPLEVSQFLLHITHASHVAIQSHNHAAMVTERRQLIGSAILTEWLKSSTFM